MTPTEMMTKLKRMTGKTDETMLSDYLELAADHVTRRAYPFNPEITTVPEIYQMAQLEIAVYLVNKVGAEGQLTHNENGINRSYESASVPNSMLKRIIPLAKVPIREEEEDENA